MSCEFKSKSTCLAISKDLNFDAFLNIHKSIEHQEVRVKYIRHINETYGIIDVLNMGSTLSLDFIFPSLVCNGMELMQ
jgi:hypothetical protein